MKGYIGYSESVRSSNAKDENRFPLSYWTKKRIMDLVEEERPDLLKKAKKTPLYVLKEKCLTKTEWHHTSCKFNITYFYEFSFSELEYLSEETIEQIKAERKAKLDATKDGRERKRKENQLKKEALELMEYSKYKQKSAYLKAVADGRVKLEDLREIKAQVEADNSKQAVMSALGNLKKYTEFKKVKPFFAALENKTFDIDSIDTDLITEKRELDFLDTVKKYFA